MAQLNKDIFEEFESITNYPLSDFIKVFAFFVTNNYPKIVSYFSNESDVADAQSFKNLQSLLKESVKIFGIISENSERFNNYKWWVLIDELEKVKIKLETSENSSKWLRSSISQVRFTPQTADITLKQGQTIESLAREKVGIEDWNNDWKDIAVLNNVAEEDYTLEGGNLLKVVLQGNNSFFLQTVVDNLQGDAVLGKDLDKNLSFDDNDLRVLSPQDTFQQSIQILSSLKILDNPEQPDQGLSQAFIVGSNINLLTFPTIIRQMTNTFNTDDTVKSFSIVSIDREQDAVFITFDIENRLGDIDQISTILSA